jgi:uncharacterized glyoxalase superfamily protein PhnB
VRARLWHRTSRTSRLNAATSIKLVAREFNDLAGCSPTQWIAEEFRNVLANPGSARQAQAMSDNTPAPQVWPTLRARDARALIRFLVEVIGFEETAVYGDGDRVDHAQLSWPLGGGIMLGSARDDDNDQWPLRPGTFGAYVVTDDPDALFARAKRAGAEIIRELTDTDYGSRDFGLRDPEGNRWSFGTYRGEPRKA